MSYTWIFLTFPFCCLFFACYVVFKPCVLYNYWGANRVDFWFFFYFVMLLFFLSKMELTPPQNSTRIGVKYDVINGRFRGGMQPDSSVRGVPPTMLITSALIFLGFSPLQSREFVRRWHNLVITTILSLSRNHCMLGWGCLYVYVQNAFTDIVFFWEEGGQYSLSNIFTTNSTWNWLACSLRFYTSRDSPVKNHGRVSKRISDSFAARDGFDVLANSPASLASSRYQSYEWGGGGSQVWKYKSCIQRCIFICFITLQGPKQRKKKARVSCGTRGLQHSQQPKQTNPRSRGLCPMFYFFLIVPECGIMASVSSHFHTFEGGGGILVEFHFRFQKRLNPR